MVNFTWSQSYGDISDPGGEVWGSGYSGFGAGKNNPAMQNIHNVGPIPQGWYTIGDPYNSEKLGPFVMDLIQDPENEMFDRDEFRMHGDSISHPGSASEGCIVLDPVTRHKVAASGIKRLQVIA